MKTKYRSVELNVWSHLKLYKQINFGSQNNKKNNTKTNEQEKVKKKEIIAVYELRCQNKTLENKFKHSYQRFTLR